VLARRRRRAASGAAQPPAPLAEAAAARQRRALSRAVWNHIPGVPRIDATCLRSSICAMAWRFHAIDATLSP
jgi:hypothetical protein